MCARSEALAPTTWWRVFPIYTGCFLWIDSAIRPAPECPNIGIVMCLTTAPRYRDVNFVINYLKRLFDFDQLITLARQHAYTFDAKWPGYVETLKLGCRFKNNARMTLQNEPRCNTNTPHPGYATNVTLRKTQFQLPQFSLMTPWRDDAVTMAQSPLSLMTSTRVGTSPPIAHFHHEQWRHNAPGWQRTKILCWTSLQ